MKTYIFFRTIFFILITLQLLSMSKQANTQIIIGCGNDSTISLIEYCTDKSFKDYKCLVFSGSTGISEDSLIKLGKNIKLLKNNIPIKLINIIPDTLGTDNYFIFVIYKENANYIQYGDCEPKILNDIRNISIDGNNRYQIIILLNIAKIDINNLNGEKFGHLFDVIKKKNQINYYEKNPLYWELIANYLLFINSDSSIVCDTISTCYTNSFELSNRDSIFLNNYFIWMNYFADYYYNIGTDSNIVKYKKLEEKSDKFLFHISKLDTLKRSKIDSLRNKLEYYKVYSIYKLYKNKYKGYNENQWLDTMNMLQKKFEDPGNKYHFGAKLLLANTYYALDMDKEAEEIYIYIRDSINPKAEEKYRKAVENMLDKFKKVN
ncbi:MAG TPA: hypothetical protein VIL99_16630 [Ignavibacteria bacterium]